MKLVITTEMIANKKYAVTVEVGEYYANSYFETSNEIFALYKGLQLACYNCRNTAFEVVTNSASFAYDLKHIAESKQRLALITKQTLRRTGCSINGVTVA